MHLTRSPEAQAAAHVDVGLGEVRPFGDAVSGVFACYAQQGCYACGVQARHAAGHDLAVLCDGGVHLMHSRIHRFRRRSRPENRWSWRRGQA